MTQASIGRSRERMQLSLLTVALAWATVPFVYHPVVAHADTLCPVAVFPSVDVVTAPCPTVPSGSFCLYWQTAEGVFTPTQFSTQEGALTLEGTFSGAAHAFSGFVYNLVEEPVRVPVGEVSVGRSTVTIRGDRQEHGPYVPDASVQYTSTLTFAFVVEEGPGLSAVAIEPLTLTAYPSSRLVAWALRRAGDEPAAQAEVLNEFLFNLEP